MSTDQMTGVQAVARNHPALPRPSGPILRREFEYERPGTLSFIVTFEGASGRLGQISAGSTRNEADVRAHIRATVDAEPRILQWPFIVANLNTHPSASLVRYVAQESDRAIDLGIKGQSGILGSLETRPIVLSDPTHRIVFHYTP